MAQENLYQAPESELVKTSGNYKEVVKIAKLQKSMVGCFLGYMIIAISISFLQQAQPAFVVFAQALGVLSLLMLVLFTARLCWNVYGKVAAVAMVLLCFVPLINLLVVIAASSRATHRIKSNGFKVGLLGANLSKMTTTA